MFRGIARPASSQHRLARPASRCAKIHRGRGQVIDAHAGTCQDSGSGRHQRHRMRSEPQREATTGSTTRQHMSAERIGCRAGTPARRGPHGLVILIDEARHEGYRLHPVARVAPIVGGTDRHDRWSGPWARTTSRDAWSVTPGPRHATAPPRSCGARHRTRQGPGCRRAADQATSTGARPDATVTLVRRETLGPRASGGVVSGSSASTIRLASLLATPSVSWSLRFQMSTTDVSMAGRYHMEVSKPSSDPP